MRAILQTIAGSGSGYGISYWSNWMRCEKAAFFAETAVRGPTTKPALVTGTVAHGFLELYYKLAMKNAKRALTLDTMAVSFVDDAGDPCDFAEAARLEGERIFRAYRRIYPPDELGEIVAVEQKYEGKDVQRAVQCNPFTFKPDVEVYEDARNAKRLFKTRRIQVSKGYYLVDHKTDGGREWADQMFMNSVQFTAYMVGWQARYPKRELMGLLVNVLPKTKNPEFRTLVVPYPTQKQQQVLFDFLEQAQERRNRALLTKQPLPNITHCFGFEPCSFINSCSRAA